MQEPLGPPLMCRRSRRSRAPAPPVDACPLILKDPLHTLLLVMVVECSDGGSGSSCAPADVRLAGNRT